MKLSKNKWQHKDNPDEESVELTFYSQTLDFIEFMNDSGKMQMLPREIFLENYYELV